jgi:hypothetical protein
MERAAANELERQAAEIEGLQQRVRELEREVEFLRRYGNKDCTAMADAALVAEELAQ